MMLAMACAGGCGGADARNTDLASIVHAATTTSIGLAVEIDNGSASRSR